VCLSLAFSFGRLADRWGRAKVLLLGHGLLVLVWSHSGERTALVVFGAVLTGALAALAATLLELDALARPEAAR
jgi:hypothetical protein